MFEQLPCILYSNVCLIFPINRGNYPPPAEYFGYVDKSNINLVEAFRRMHVDEESMPLENGSYDYEVLTP